uniref:Uncharacterized protein n=1 Tax=Anguilla anguilla TaxID=7936 RepID=A0A0E9VXH1_ANGAN
MHCTVMLLSRAIYVQQL